MIILLKILGLSFVISKFEPKNWFIDMLPENIFKWILSVMTNCFKCCSFWTGLIIGGLWYGVIAYIIAFFYQRFLGKYEYEKLN